MKLTRHQADLVLRHYTAEYAANVPAVDDNPEERATLARKLSHYLDANVHPYDIQWITEVWRDAFANKPAAEHDVNFEINAALDSAGFRGPHILRYTEQETAA